MGLNGEGTGPNLERGRKRKKMGKVVVEHEKQQRSSPSSNGDLKSCKMSSVAYEGAISAAPNNEICRKKSRSSWKRKFGLSRRQERSKRMAAAADADGDEEREQVDDEVSPDRESDMDAKSYTGGTSSVPVSSPGDRLKPVEKRSMTGTGSYLSKSRFDQCSLSPLSLKGIKAAGFEMMTIVQEATLPFILKGKDVLAKAKTGTGKTLAFLVPTIEVVAKLASVGLDSQNHPINVLVICPTRELADQVTVETGKVLKYHLSIGVQLLIGGTNKALEQKRIQANPCQIIVATPGRLRDHIENTDGFSSRLLGLKILVLDEADRLLDLGFRKDIEKILSAVPKQRQTLLFSATISNEVRQICHIAMKKDHCFIDTVQEGCEETHSQVRQLYLLAPLEQQFYILYSILTDHIAEDIEYKVIVFCTTAMGTKLVADLMALLNLNVREIHSRKSQSYRTKISNEFRESKALILVSSDVSSRGVDYPNVTLVVQMGIPADREQYIHRLGRTGRSGKEGKGILILAPFEGFFLDGIRDLPIGKATAPCTDINRKNTVERALSLVKMNSKVSAFKAWLGYYLSVKSIGRDKNKLVEYANQFSQSMGLDSPPPLSAKIIRRMGLAIVPGLRSK